MEAEYLILLMKKRFLVVGIEKAKDGELVTMPYSDEETHAGDTLVFLHV